MAAAMATTTVAASVTYTSTGKSMTAAAGETPVPAKSAPEFATVSKAFVTKSMTEPIVIKIAVKTWSPIVPIKARAVVAVIARSVIAIIIRVVIAVITVPAWARIAVVPGAAR